MGVSIWLELGGCMASIGDTILKSYKPQPRLFFEAITYIEATLQKIN